MELPVTPNSVPMAEWLESAWLARYLDRQLARDELAWFEAYVLTRPKLLDMVETDTRLRDTMAANAAQVRPARVVEVDPVYDLAVDNSAVENSAVDNLPADNRAPAVAGVREPAAEAPVSRVSAVHRFARPATLAAAAVLGLGVGVFGQRISRPGVEASAVIATPMRVVYDTLRGASVERPMVEHAGSAARYALIEVAVPSSAQRVALQLEGRESALTPSTDGFVSFLVDRRVFAKDAAAVVRYEVDGRASQRRISLDLAGGPVAR